MNVFGLARSVFNPMTAIQLAMGPAGWASIALRTLTNAVAQQAIQTLGERLNLPQSVINLAQSQAGFATGRGSLRDTVNSLARDAGLNLIETASLQRTAQEAQRQLVNSLIESDEFKAAKSGGGGSIFMKIAAALGKLADQKMNEMASLADRIGGIKDGKNGNQVTELTGKMQAKGQEFSLISNAMSTTINTLGNGLSQLARKG